MHFDILRKVTGPRTMPSMTRDAANASIPAQNGDDQVSALVHSQEYEAASRPNARISGGFGKVLGTELPEMLSMVLDISGQPN